jgi:TolA-binding protein
MQALEEARQHSRQQVPVTIDSLREGIEGGQGGFDFRDKMKLQPTPLHSTEEMLAQAYDNFIMLFPHDKDTPLFLANAGALYYHHNQFRNALKYFKTLLKHFPGSEQVNQARFAILESYFGKADFKSTEIIAKKILADSVASLSLQDRARRRLAEAIFLNAEMLAKAEQHFQAGNEYRRMVDEVPESSFADLALFNAALEYDKANEFNRAIETYQALLSTQPNSPYIYDAQNNMAFDYAELDDFRNAALVYKRLAIIHPDSSKARDALYNSSLYFAKAEDWENAVDVNTRFLERFPNDPEAEELAFEIPKFYNQMNKIDRAFREYQDFIETYPNNRNVIEAHFRRGQYYRKRGETREALEEYQQAIRRQAEFEEQGLEENIYFASESEYAMARIKFDTFASIEFRLSERELRESKERKKRLLLDVIRHLRNVTTFGTMRVYEATHLIGEAYREFAATWADQDIPEMERTRRIVAQKEVNDAARVLYERAADAYRQSISATIRLSDGYRQSLAEEQEVPVDSLVISPQDSVIRIADTWLERSKTQLTRVNYQIADISLKTAHSVLEAPVPSRLGYFSALVYQKQVVDSVVTPLIDNTLDIYKRNLVEADTFDIQSEWVELSKQKLLSTQNITAAEYAELAQEGLSVLRDRMDRYREIVFSGRRFEDVLGRLQALYDDMMNINAFNQKSVETSLDTYRQTVLLARNLQVEEKYVAETKNSMMSTAYFFALRTDSTSIEAKALANRAREAFLQDDTPLLEEGLFTFNSAYFALRDAERAILEEGYELASQLNIVNIYSQNLTLQLVRFDPESYASLLDLDIQTRDLVADTSWLASPDYYEGWTLSRFDESAWNPAVRASVFSDDNRPGIWTYTLENQREIVERVKPDTTVMDTVIKRVRVPAQTAFFRKSFSVEGLPVACMAEFAATGIATLYFNGDRITEKSASSDSLQEYDLSDLLIDGRNVLSLKVVSPQESRYGLECRLRIKSLPHWDERLEMLRPELASEEMKKKLLIEQGRIP